MKDSKYVDYITPNELRNQNPRNMDMAVCEFIGSRFEHNGRDWITSLEMKDTGIKCCNFCGKLNADYRNRCVECKCTILVITKQD